MKYHFDSEIAFEMILKYHFEISFFYPGKLNGSNRKA